MAGGSSGEIVLAGDLGSSRLWALVSHAEEPKMPPKQDKLAAAKLDLISKWIEQGAPENAGSKVAHQEEPAGRWLPCSKIGKPAGPVADARGPVQAAGRYTPSGPGRSRPSPPAPGRRWSRWPGKSRSRFTNSDSGELLGDSAVPRGHSARRPLQPQRQRAAGRRRPRRPFGLRRAVRREERQADRQDRRRAGRGAGGRHQQQRTRWWPSAAPTASCGSTRPRPASCCTRSASTPTGSTAVEFSPDGKLLATADRSGGLFVWEAETAREYLNLRGHNGAVCDVSWRLDSNDPGQRRRRRDGQAVGAERRQRHQVLECPCAAARSASDFTHDGRLVSAGRDNTVKTWAGDGAAQKSFPAFTEAALRCTFTHDGKRVVGGDWLGNVKLWDAGQATLVYSLAANPPTLAKRVELAKADIAAKQAAAAAAAAELAAVTKIAADKAAALKAATDKHVAATSSRTEGRGRSRRRRQSG